MTDNDSRGYTILAVKESALELGLKPLDDSTVERVVDYGIEALVECTLALDQPFVVDANVRGVIYARSIERISQIIATSHGVPAVIA